MCGLEHDALETVAPGAHNGWEFRKAADAGFLARKEEKSSTWLRTDRFVGVFFCWVVFGFFFFFFFLDFGSESYRTLSHLSWVMTL